MRELGVDFVFNGHRHFHMRSRAMYGNTPRANIDDFIIDESDGNVRREFYWERQGVVHMTQVTTGGAFELRNNFQHRTGHTFFPDHTQPVANSNVASFFGREEPVRTARHNTHGDSHSVPAGVGILPGIGTLSGQQGGGGYTIVTIEGGNLTADVFVRIGGHTGQFHHFETFGVRKNYYRTLERDIAALIIGDTEAFQSVYDRMIQYRALFPELAARISTESIARLETGLIAGYRDALNAAITNAEARQAENYTRESWAALQTALAVARIRQDSEVKIDIEMATTALNTAIEGLVPIIDIEKDRNSGCGTAATLGGGLTLIFVGLIILTLFSIRKKR